MLEGDSELQQLLEKLRLYQLRATLQLEVRAHGAAGRRLGEGGQCNACMLGPWLGRRRLRLATHAECVCEGAVIKARVLREGEGDDLLTL